MFLYKALLMGKHSMWSFFIAVDAFILERGPIIGSYYVQTHLRSTNKYTNGFISFHLNNLHDCQRCLNDLQTLGSTQFIQWSPVRFSSSSRVEQHQGGWGRSAGSGGTGTLDSGTEWGTTSWRPSCNRDTVRMLHLNTRASFLTTFVRTAYFLDFLLYW